MTRFQDSSSLLRGGGRGGRGGREGKGELEERRRGRSEVGGREIGKKSEGRRKGGEGGREGSWRKGTEREGEREREKVHA